MVSREQVFYALNTERAYQESRIDKDSGSREHTVEDFILFMEHYLFEARRVASTTWGPPAKPATLEFVRKVTALGVACMEKHGAPLRAGFEFCPPQPGGDT